MAKPRDPNRPQNPNAVQAFGLGDAFATSGAAVMEALPEEKPAAKPAAPAQKTAKPDFDPATLALGQQVIAQSINQSPIPNTQNSDAAPFFQFLGEKNAAADAPQNGVSFGLTDIMSAVGASFGSGPNYRRPESILSHVIGPAFDNSASQRSVGSVLAGKLNVPIVENLTFLAPVHGRISDQVGIRKVHPVTGETNVAHHGTDFAVPIGTSVKAPADGAVAYTGWINGYGNTVVLVHHDTVNGYFATAYAHLKSINDVRVGDVVHQGQQIALSGNTGKRSTAPHLHMELMKIENNGHVTAVSGVGVMQSGGLTAAQVEEMSGIRANASITAKLNAMGIQLAAAEGPKMPAPAPTLN